MRVVKIAVLQIPAINPFITIKHYHFCCKHICKVYHIIGTLVCNAHGHYVLSTCSMI